MFYKTQALFPTMPTEAQKSIKWEGKKLRIHWNDKSFTDFPALSLEHWLSMLRFAHMENQLAGKNKKKH